jgi:hypothetical protein
MNACLITSIAKTKYSFICCDLSLEKPSVINTFNNVPVHLPDSAAVLAYWKPLHKKKTAKKKVSCFIQ